MFTEKQEAELEALRIKVDDATRGKLIGEDDPIHSLRALLRILTGRDL